MLSQEHRMAAHGRLFAVVGRVCRGESLVDETPRVCEDCEYPSTLEICQVGTAQDKARAEAGSGQCGKEIVGIAHGSAGSVKVWLNDSVVDQNNKIQSCNNPPQKVKVALKEGWNPLMLKVTKNSGGDWGALVRVVSAGGKNLDGLKFKAE